VNVLIEQAQNTDIPVIYAQAKTLIDTYENLSAIDYDEVMNWVERKITQNISQYRCLIADGNRCAFWRLCPDGELDDLYVLPPYRGKGIGSLILKNCIAESKNDIYLYVFSRNTRAIAFYKRFGFTVCQTIGNTRMILARKG